MPLSVYPETSLPDPISENEMFLEFWPRLCTGPMIRREGIHVQYANVLLIKYLLNVALTRERGGREKHSLTCLTVQTPNSMSAVS